MKILIVTLAVDEPQLPILIGQIKTICTTSSHKIKHIVIQGLSAIEAMEKLVLEVKTHREFDLLIKIDADMIFRSIDSFSKIIDLYLQANTSRLTISVFDCIIGINIYGIHLINIHELPSDICITKTKRDDWFLQIKNSQTYILHDPLILHCPNASIQQYYNFGYNRGLKHRIKNQNFLYVFLLLLFSRQTNSNFGLRGFRDGYSRKATASFDHTLLSNALLASPDITLNDILSIIFDNYTSLVKSILEIIYLKSKSIKSVEFK